MNWAVGIHAIKTPNAEKKKIFEEMLLKALKFIKCQIEK